MIENEAISKKWKPFRVGVNGVGNTHIMFTDDLLLFGEATKIHMERVQKTLNEFCEMSGQEISMEKSSIMFSCNVNRGLQTKICHTSGF